MSSINALQEYTTSKGFQYPMYESVENPASARGPASFVTTVRFECREKGHRHVVKGSAASRVVDSKKNAAANAVVLFRAHDLLGSCPANPPVPGQPGWIADDTIDY
jgi:hypothetical protein